MTANSDRLSSSALVQFAHERFGVTEKLAGLAGFGGLPSHSAAVSHGTTACSQTASLNAAT